MSYHQLSTRQVISYPALPISIDSPPNTTLDVVLADIDAKLGAVAAGYDSILTSSANLDTVVLNTTGATVNGLNSLVVASVAGIFQGLSITGPGIPSDTQVKTIVGSTITMTRNAIFSAVNVPIRIGIILQAQVLVNSSGNVLTK
jgi:hypothetical protein